MAILQVIRYPDPLLRRVSSPVEKIDDNIRKLMDDMVETMYHKKGVGLAAVQVGVLKRIFIFDDSEERNRPLFFVNPVIKPINQEKELKDEGCLSLPGADGGKVLRYKEIEISYLDYEGRPQIMQTSGLLAQAIQHEYDHLEGIIFSDHLSPIKKMLLNKKTLKYVEKPLKNTHNEL